MPNPLFNELGKNAPDTQTIRQQLMQFKNNFRGNAREEVMKLLQSGRINQQQLDELQAKAEQIKQMLGLS